MWVLRLVAPVEAAGDSCILKDNARVTGPQLLCYSIQQISPEKAPGTTEQRKAIPDELLEFLSHRDPQYNKRGASTIKFGVVY